MHSHSYSGVVVAVSVLALNWASYVHMNSLLSTKLEHSTPVVLCVYELLRIAMSIIIHSMVLNVILECGVWRENNFSAASINKHISRNNWIWTLLLSEIPYFAILDWRHSIDCHTRSSYSTFSASAAHTTTGLCTRLSHHSHHLMPYSNINGDCQAESVRTEMNDANLAK